MKISTLLLVLILAACSAPEEPPPPEEKPPQGRAETQSIRNTEAIGYSGNAVADKVDAALTKTEERKEETDRAAEEQTQ